MATDQRDFRCAGCNEYGCPFRFNPAMHKPKRRSLLAWLLRRR